MYTIPQKLKIWDEIRIIAPAVSMWIASKQQIEYTKSVIQNLWFKISFWRNCNEIDIMNSSSIESRINDLHMAFLDKNIKAILTFLWWFNSNQLLDYIDYSIIKNNPKIFCWYSDITALQNAFTSQTKLITYSGLHFSTFWMKKYCEYNIEYFKKCLMNESSFFVEPIDYWTNDAWFADQENRNPIKNHWFWIINKWVATWTIFGWNQCTLNLLQGTKYFPDLENSILFLEDDELTWQDFSKCFDRDLQSLIHLPQFCWVKWIVIWRTQPGTDMTREKMEYIISTKKELKNIPVIANVDFWHTNQLITFPIWWTAKIISDKSNPSIEILIH